MWPSIYRSEMWVQFHVGQSHGQIVPHIVSHTIIYNAHYKQTIHMKWAWGFYRCTFGAGFNELVWSSLRSTLLPRSTTLRSSADIVSDSLQIYVEGTWCCKCDMVVQNFSAYYTWYYRVVLYVALQKRGSWLEVWHIKREYESNSKRLTYKYKV